MSDQNAGQTGTGAMLTNEELTKLIKERDDLKSTNAGLDRKIADLLNLNKTLESNISEMKNTVDTEKKGKLSEIEQLKNQLAAVQDQLNQAAHETAKEKRAKLILEKCQEYKLDDPDYRDLLISSPYSDTDIEAKIKTRAESIQKAINQKAEEVVAQRVNGTIPPRGTTDGNIDFSKMDDTELHKLGNLRPELNAQLIAEQQRRARTQNLRRM